MLETMSNGESDGHGVSRGNDEKILANQEKILANQAKIAGNQEALAKILANQEGDPRQPGQDRRQPEGR